MASGCDHFSFDDFYARHASLVMRVTRNRLRDRRLAEEAFNSTFAQLAKIPDRLVAAGRGIEALITHIAIQTSLDVARREAREQAMPVDPTTLGAAPVSAPPSLDPAVALLRAELRSRVVTALNGIRPELRRVLYLHEVEGVAYEELAGAEGVTAKALRASAERARRRLTHVLDVARRGVPAAAMVLRRVRARLALVRGSGGDWVGRMTELVVTQPLTLVGSVAVMVGVAPPANPSPEADAHSRIVLGTPTTVPPRAAAGAAATSSVPGRVSPTRPNTDGHPSAVILPTAQAVSGWEGTRYSGEAGVEAESTEGNKTGDEAWLTVELPPCLTALPRLACNLRAWG